MGIDINKIHCMDALEGLKQMDSESVDCIITSPPYYALRQYGIDNQLGLEVSYQDYVKRLCDIFDEAKRVLKKEGTCFLNLGDTYKGGCGGPQSWERESRGIEWHEESERNPHRRDKKVWLDPKNPHEEVLRGREHMTCNDIEDKSLMMIPYRVAIEMINRGWTLRNQIIWCLEENTKLFVKLNHNYAYMTIKELYEIEDRWEMRVLTQNMKGENIWINIKNILLNGEQDCYKIKTKTGKEIIATENHEFVYKSNASLKQTFRKIKLKKVSELKIDDCLYSNDAMNLGHKKETEQDYTNGFIVGFYLAEGSFIKNKVGIYKDNKLSLNAQKRWGINKEENKLVGLQFSCGIKDIERGYIEYLKAYDIKIRQYKNYIHVQSRDKNLLELIKKYIIGDTCHIKHFTQEVFNESKKFIEGVVDGFLAGDGYYDIKNNRYRIGICANYNLKDDMLLLCRILGYDFRFCSERKVKYQNGYKQTIDFTIRKENYRTRSFGCSTDRIESIEYVGKKYVYDIEVVPIYTTFCGKGITYNPTMEKRKNKYNNLYFLGNGIWTHNSKPNCMPSSANDRYTVDFEPVFFFVKNRYYYFEQQREPHKFESIRRACRARTSNKLKADQYACSYMGDNVGYENMYDKLENGELRGVHPNGRNMRCVWDITLKPFRDGDHFATFPEDLIEPMIRAGCPENGVVLDPFMGAGTTALVALKNRKKFIGIELNSEYIKIAEERIRPYIYQTGLSDFVDVK
jgi:DNA modification methylase